MDYDTRATTAAERFAEKCRQESFSFQSITLHGAEPSIISARALGKIINIFWGSTGNQVHIQSNGTRLTEPYLTQLLEVIESPDRLFVGISIDGSPEIHNPQRNNTWQMVTNNIKTLRRHGFAVGLMSVITPLTMKNLQSFGQWVESIKSTVQGLTFKLGEHGFGLTEEEKTQFAHWLYESKNIKHLQAFMPDLCMHGGNNCHFNEFDINGHCYSCNKSYSQEGLFANWLEETFVDICAKRKPLYHSRQVDPECHSCTYYSLCYCGCPLSREQNKSVDCKIKKTIYPKLLQKGIRAETFFAVEKQSTALAMEQALYNDLPLADARVLISPRLQHPSNLGIDHAESKFLEILLVDPSVTICEALERLSKTCPDISEETLAHQALSFLKNMHERDLLSFAASNQ